MPLQPLSPTPEKTPPNPWLSWPMVAVLLLGGGYFFGLRSMGLLSAKLNFIFPHTASGWEQVRTPAGSLDMLRVSAGGTLWVRTWGRSALSRWDGKAWQYFKDADFPNKTTYKDNEFALDGEEVWAPTEQGVLHFDGAGWTSYKEAASSEGASIVAGGGHVWVIDHTGKLSHFANGKWTSEKLALPGVTWTNNPDEGDPELALTANGNLWLDWEGVWRFDGARWSAVTVGTDRLNNAQLIGATGDRVWFSDESGLRSVSMDGKQADLYTAAQMAMEEPPVVTDIAASGGRTWFATLHGLLEFDGSTWHLQALPSNKVSGFRRVAVGKGGDLWVIGAPSREAFQSFQRTVRLILILPLALIGLLVWIILRSRRRQLVQHRLVTEAVQHATGEVPEELQRGEQSLKWGGWLVTIVGTILGFVLLRMIWPKTPAWCAPLITVALHMMFTFWESLRTRKPKPSDPIGPGAPSRYDWGKTATALAGGAFLILVLNADRFPMLGFLRGWMLWLVLAPSVYHGLMLSLMNRAIKRANYDRALNIIRWSYFYNPSAVEALRMSGHVLLMAGRYREAEDTLRRSLASAHARESYGSALEFLGDTLMEQGRYDEATRSYEAALHAFPWRRRPYRGMAEMHLRQGKRAEQAIEWIEKITDFKGLSFGQRKMNGRPEDDYWALKAWALARLGRRQETDDAIENALKATDKNVLPDLAATYYRAGLAMQALGKDAEARDYFERAVQSDPIGRRGKLAKAAIEAGNLQAVDQIRAY